MYRLAELTDTQRRRLGWAALLAGSVLLAAAVIWIHYSQLAETELVGDVQIPIVVDYFNWVPRGWLSKSVGYLAAFGASQLLLGGAALVWVLNQRMTWARASVAALLTWIELVLIFGIVPSEWLNLSQTDLDWSGQRVALTIPSWLVLGNDIDISLGVIKDSISMGYTIVMIGAAVVFAIQVQGIRKGRPPQADKPQPMSPYGRPLTRGDR
jgi:hypothetical protein